MNDVILLQENICNIQKEQADLNSAIRDCDKEVRKITDKLETTLTVLNLNQSNKTFIRSKAEVVNLEEFKNIKSKIEDLQDEVTECNKQLSILTKSKEKLQTKLDFINTKLEKSQAKLQTYCKVITLNVQEKHTS